MLFPPSFFPATNALCSSLLFRVEVIVHGIFFKISDHCLSIQRHTWCDTRVGKYCDIFKISKIQKIIQKNHIFFDIFDIYRAFAHTLLKYKIYYEIVICVCAWILGEVLSSFTLHCCREVQSDRSCPNAKGNNCKTPGLLTSKRSHNVSC